MSQSYLWTLSSSSRIFDTQIPVYNVRGGREIARLTEVIAPTAPAALKELYAYHILDYEISGRNHLYILDRKNKTISSTIKTYKKREQLHSCSLFKNWLLG